MPNSIISREQIAKTNGRIFSITYRTTEKRKADGTLVKASKIEKYDIRTGVTKGLVNPQAEYVAPVDKDPNLLTAWCMKRAGWRTFKMDQILDSSLLKKSEGQGA